jgi:spiro-SPASM protein
MTLDKFNMLVQNIAEFSGDAVISLSFWGEALHHPQFAAFIETILSYPDMSVLVETDGLSLTEETVQAVADLVHNHAVPGLNNDFRLNGQKAVNWIVSIDACDRQHYRELHGIDAYDQAVAAVKLLKSFFPGAVYPQLVRIKDNEESLEPFYRQWKADGNGELIIQKYDWYSGLLPDRKVADLSPLERRPCWHLRRDMNILVTGDVPFCREYVLENSIGNVFEEALETIWAREQVAFAEHCEHQYSGKCGECDEYYTFNF